MEYGVRVEVSCYCASHGLGRASTSFVDWLRCLTPVIYTPMNHAWLDVHRGQRVEVGLRWDTLPLLYSSTLLNNSFEKGGERLLYRAHKLSRKKIQIVYDLLGTRLSTCRSCNVLRITWTNRALEGACTPGVYHAKNAT